MFCCRISLRLAIAFVLLTVLFPFLCLFPLPLIVGYHASDLPEGARWGPRSPQGVEVMLNTYVYTDLYQTHICTCMHTHMYAMGCVPLHGAEHVC